MARKRRPSGDAEPVSRSQKKRDAAALKVLGERLTELSDEALKRIEMPEELREAVRFARTLTQHGARRRQIQLIGKLMREADSGPIRRALDTVDQVRGHDVRRFRQVESTRDAIVRGDDDALEAAAGRLPDDQRTELERLTDDARREQAAGQPRGAGRALFRFLMNRMPE